MVLQRLCLEQLPCCRKSIQDGSYEEGNVALIQTLPAMFRDIPKKLWTIIKPNSPQPLTLFHTHNLPILDNEEAEHNFFCLMFTIEPNGKVYLPSIIAIILLCPIL